MKVDGLRRACQATTMAFMGIVMIPAAGCRREAEPAISLGPAAPGPKEAPKALVFRPQELPFRYDRGETGAAWPSETTGGGVGLLDYDGDGHLDLFFAQGGPLVPRGGQTPMADVLLRNLGGGRFEDVSTAAGLVPKGYGQGVTVADYDGDGDPDVYVTRYGRNTLWRNDRGRFHRRYRRGGRGLPALEPGRGLPRL